MSSRSGDWSRSPKEWHHTTTLTSEQISDAVQLSPDKGATLDFSKLRITDVSEPAAEQLAQLQEEGPKAQSLVLKIALGSNKLSTLPMAFASLSRVRYLNLKHNSFTVFPEVLTMMTSLDTLDMSYNKIKRLPSQPGNLVNLRVFSFSKNKVTRLPSYLTRFDRLEVLKVDRNPVEWPPKLVVDPSRSLDTPQAMKDWIWKVQAWLKDDTKAKTIDLTKLIDDSGFSEPYDEESSRDSHHSSWTTFPIRASDFDAGVTPHARTFSVDSNFSMSSMADSTLDSDVPTSTPLPDRPPPLHLGILQSYSETPSPSRSPESYLPSPAESVFSSADESVSATTEHTPLAHGRNASYAGGIRNNTSRNELGMKKSMPDLRTAKLNFTKKIPLPERGSSSKHKMRDDFSMPSPSSTRQDSSSSMGSNSRLLKSSMREPVQPMPPQPVPSVDFERDSYFRRMSTLPTATIKNTLPKPLICLIDSARSILFAVCQVHQTLDHYTTHGIDDRLSSVLRKVLDPASVDMLHLIDSLDRFDALSKKKLPPPAVCRTVVESCKDTVAVFGKAVGVLALQLKVLATGGDVRYLRSMLLVLYGATSEIASAWQSMTPHIDAIKPLLYANYPQSPTHRSTAGLDTSLSGLDNQPGPMLRSHSSNALLGGLPEIVSRTRTLRRHAGSFSSKDVEIGKKLPSYDEEPVLFGGVISGTAPRTPTLRAPKRPTTASSTSAAFYTGGSPSGLKSLMSASASSLSLADLPKIAPHPWPSSHSRHGSQASLQASSSSSSPSIPTKTTFVDLPSTSKTQVDNEALNAVQEAVDVAPAVWDEMEGILSHALETNTDIRDSLDGAKDVTIRLAMNIRAMQDGSPRADRKVLRDDAHIFLKSVVQLSNIIKIHGGARSVTPTLRANMVKLTTATEEFAILLHVSSFSPSSTPRPYSPMMSASTTTHFALNASPEDSRLVPSLSRSRSAQPSSNLNPTTTPQRDPPRSALPSSSFKLPVYRRLRTGEALESPG